MDCISMDVNEVKFHLESFDGPLDLLLHLIQKNKVEITDIPIVEITRQYLEYLQQMKEFVCWNHLKQI